LRLVVRSPALPRSVTPRAAQGSFTSRFRVSVSGCQCGAAASSFDCCRAACLRARSCASFERSECSPDGGRCRRSVARKRADNHTATSRTSGPVRRSPIPGL
jgi:hypothetical protein